MARLKIVVDFDDVLINTTPHVVDEYNSRYDTNVQLKHAFVSGNLEWQAPRPEVFRRFYHIYNSDRLMNLNPRQDALDVIHILSRMHDLYVVTARDEALRDVTQLLLDRYFAGCFRDLFHAGDASKGEICKRLHADVVVDDNMKHLANADAYGMKHLLWFGDDYPWHESTEELALASPYVRCKDWYDVDAYITKVRYG